MFFLSPVSNVIHKDFVKFFLSLRRLIFFKCCGFKVLNTNVLAEDEENVEEVTDSEKYHKPDNLEQQRHEEEEVQVRRVDRECLTHALVCT